MSYVDFKWKKIYQDKIFGNIQNHRDIFILPKFMIILFCIRIMLSRDMWIKMLVWEGLEVIYGKEKCEQAL